MKRQYLNNSKELNELNYLDGACDESVVLRIFDADDEEPICMNCDNFEECDGTQCGPPNSWQLYKRTENKNV